MTIYNHIYFDSTHKKTYRHTMSLDSDSTKVETKEIV